MYVWKIYWWDGTVSYARAMTAREARQGAGKAGRLIRRVERAVPLSSREGCLN